MSLASGSRLGAYEIVSLIGAGGMGEVYRARDTRLGRDVAVKVLPQSLDRDDERLRRFELEARAAAALNNPHILAVYDVGSHDGAPYIVSELLEGSTLAERLNAGPLPARKAVDYAVQISRGLAAAHDKGIVHRDLKPANVFVTNDGRVKILDFGLAKLIAPEPAVMGTSVLPTVAPDTQPGMVLGTVGYMSPEQVRGRDADHRSDIFSFGAILYELLSGRRAFAGDTSADTMTAILKEDPPDLPLAERHIPPALERIVHRCLDKSPSGRFQSAGDLGFALEALSAHSGNTRPVAGSAPGRRWNLVWAIATVALISLIAALSVLAYSYSSRRTPDDQPAMRFSIAIPAGWEIAVANRQGVATSLVVSPNGRQLAIVARRPNGADTILLRSIGAASAQPLAGTEGVSSMFWSPDSRFLAFVANNKLQKIDTTGGPATPISDVSDTFGGGTWNQEDTIVFSSLNPGGSFTLKKVSAGGGVPTDVWAANGNGSKIRPWFLPDGRHLLYAWVTTESGPPGDTVPIEMGSLDSTDHVRVLNSGSTNVQYAQGHLLFLRDSTLMAQPFDAERLIPTGDLVPVGEQIQRQGVQPPYGLFSASQNGVLVYQTGINAGGGIAQLTWVDRSGKLIGTVSEPGNYMSMSLSRDRTRAVVGDTGPPQDLYTIDIRTGAKTRLTFGSAVVLFPLWSPDATQIAFGSVRGGPPNMYLKAANGGGGEDLALPTDIKTITSKVPSDWSRDGRYLLFVEGGDGANVWVLPMQGDRKPFKYLATRSSEFPAAVFSPDGRWIAYTSNESKRGEIYVTPFSGADPSSSSAGAQPAAQRPHKQISPGGGSSARWRGDGREIFYVSPAPNPTMMAAEVSVQGATFSVDGVKALFRVNPSPAQQGRFYDATDDGQRFLMLMSPQIKTEATAQPPTVVVNWVPRARLKK